MHVRVLKDCEVTDPPSTLFAVLIDCSQPEDSEQKFIAELLDLRGAGRVIPHLQKQGVTDVNHLRGIMNEAQTPRCHVTALNTYLTESQNSTPEYEEEILTTLEQAWLAPRVLIKSKTFVIRFFWF